jgi:hypothetical protein
VGDVRERRILELEKIFTGASTSSGKRNYKESHACSKN